jgi:hypothetical protein
MSQELAWKNVCKQFIMVRKFFVDNSNLAISVFLAWEYNKTILLRF